MPADLVNSFAFREEDGTVTIVDAGTKSARRRILRGLASVGILPEHVKQVVVTHAHSDHVGGLAKLLDVTEARVVTHERDAIFLREGRPPHRDPARSGGRIRRKLVDRTFGKVEVSEEFRDGSVLPVAGGLRVVHTPGHTPGHVSLLHESTGVLVTGDAVFNVRGLRYSPGWLCTDSALSRKSADVLGDLQYEVAAFTHGAEVRQHAREAVRAFLRGRQR